MPVAALPQIDQPDPAMVEVVAPPDRRSAVAQGLLALENLGCNGGAADVPPGAAASDEGTA